MLLLFLSASFVMRNYITSSDADNTLDWGKKIYFFHPIKWRKLFLIPTFFCLNCGGTGWAVHSTFINPVALSLDLLLETMSNFRPRNAFWRGHKKLLFFCLKLGCFSIVLMTKTTKEKNERNRALVKKEILLFFQNSLKWRKKEEKRRELESDWVSGCNAFMPSLAAAAAAA